MALTVKVEGLRELEKAFDEFESNANRKNIARRALANAGEPVADAANASAPTATGFLAKSYTTSSKLTKRQKKLDKNFWRERDGKPLVVAYIGTNARAGVYQEFGTENHRAQPHFRSAWEAGKMGVLNRVKSSIKIELKKASDRARRKALRLKK